MELYFASEVCNLEIVKKVHYLGADVNFRAGLRGTPLQATTGNLSRRRNQEEVTKFLLDHGAQVNSGNPMSPHQVTALEGAVIAGHSVSLIQMLLDYGASMTDENGEFGSALVAACTRFEKSNISIIQLLLDRGADINLRTKKHGCALHAALKNPEISVVQYLLAHSASVNTDGGKYRSALQAAAACGNFRATISSSSMFSLKRVPM